MTSSCATSRKGWASCQLPISGKRAFTSSLVLLASGLCVGTTFAQNHRGEAPAGPFAGSGIQSQGKGKDSQQPHAAKAPCLNPALREKIREVLKQANSSPAVAEALAKSRTAQKAYLDSLSTYVSARCPELAKVMQEFGPPPGGGGCNKPDPQQDFPSGPPDNAQLPPPAPPEACPADEAPPAMHGPGRQGRQGSRHGATRMRHPGSRIMGALPADFREKARQTMDEARADPQLAALRNTARESWENYRKLLREEVIRISPEVDQELGKIGPKGRPGERHGMETETPPPPPGPPDAEN